MGRFITSTQIYNSELSGSKDFIDMFCKEMKSEGYSPCDSDESEFSYILRFANNCKWVTIASEEYEQGNQLSRKDAGRIAKMLGTFCVNIRVIDSDCAVLDIFDKNGKRADSLIMGRANDYFGDDIPQPDKRLWSQFLSGGTTWEQFAEICNSNEVFVEDSLLKIAKIIGMDGRNILFSAEDAREDGRTVFLCFKEARASITMSCNAKIIDNAPKKLTLNTAFKQIIGKALEPYGFKVVKGRHPYIVRVINNEILHIITFCNESPEYPPDKAFAIMGSIATIYRKKITLDQSPKVNYNWFRYMFDFYNVLVDERDKNVLSQLFISCYYSDRPDTLVSSLNQGAENLIKYVLPVMDRINDIDSCLEHLEKLQLPRNQRQCEKICSYYPDEDEAFLNFLSGRGIAEHPHFLDKFLTDNEFHEWVMAEIEKRKNVNTEILKAYELYSSAASKKEKKLTLNAAFKQVFSEALESFGYKQIKSHFPYYVKCLNGEILHIISIISDKKGDHFHVSVVGGVATIYRKKIDFTINPRAACGNWLEDMALFYRRQLPMNYDVNVRNALSTIIISANATDEDLLCSVKHLLSRAMEWMIPIIESTIDIKSTLLYYYQYQPKLMTVYLPGHKFFNLGHENECFLLTRISNRDIVEVADAVSEILENEQHFVKVANKNEIVNIEEEKNRLINNALLLKNSMEIEKLMLERINRNNNSLIEYELI